MRVFETRDKALLRSVLDTDRVAGAYQLGDLDDPLFGHGRWILARRDRRPSAEDAEDGYVALVLEFGALADPVVVSFGSAAGVAAILDREAANAAGKFENGYLKIPPEHEAVFARRFRFTERIALHVMALDIARAGGRDAVATHDVRRLTSAFPLADVMDVYRSYPNHFFQPEFLDSGVYFGSFEGTRLVAIAGTHVFSPGERVAALGNIVTASDARCRGHAGACTARVVEEVVASGCETVVLHVAEGNEPAIRCYRRLGFVEAGTVLQITAAPPS